MTDERHDAMNQVLLDAQAARAHVLAGHWIGRSAEQFRHLPPPLGPVWLGAAAPGGATTHQHEAPLVQPDSGWLVSPMTSPSGRNTQDVQVAQDRIEARWLDMADAHQRHELFAGLQGIERGEAAPFTWAHRALCREGLRLRVGDITHSARGPVVIRVSYSPCAQVEAPLLVLDLMAGVECILLELHERHAAVTTRVGRKSAPRAIVQNLQLHFNVGSNASLRHVRIVRPGAHDQVAHHVNVHLANGAAYRQALLATGSSYHLQRSVVDLADERATAHLGSTLLADSCDIDQQVDVTHAAAQTASSVEAQCLGAGKARIVASARTRIAKDASDAQVRQRLNGIPTSGEPRLVLRPHLEILHDQVQAAHGATWGALPEEALFYATQRGIAASDARALILHGLAQATLERALDMPELLTSCGLEDQLRRAIAGHLNPTAHARHD